MLTVKAGIVLISLNAIAIGPVPLEWLAPVLLVAGWAITGSRRGAVPASLVLLLVWSLCVQGVTMYLCPSESSCVDLRMPSGATTSYPVFIALRFMALLGFIAMIALIHSLLDRHQEIVRFLVNYGTIVAGVALYVYAAQITGLPDIPRTRLGTDGQAVTQVVFTYAFHRALGTFREPAELASWLILPFFLSMLRFNWRTVLIASAILLSGSMSGFVSIAAGSAIGFGFIVLRRARQKTWLIRLPAYLALGLGLAMIPFMLLAVSNSGEFSLLGVVLDRLLPILEGGIEVSNRGYVYEYVAAIGVPLLGDGFGNSNIIYSNWLNIDVVAGLLSLYLNVLLSLGPVGVLLLLTFLVRPVLIPSAPDVTARVAWVAFGAYFAFLVAFTVTLAEFPLMFAVCYGLVRGLGVTYRAPAQRATIGLPALAFRR